MATASDIGANFSDYKGDPFLGGADQGVIKIDTQPLMQLAQFTFYSKRDKWQKQQQETDAKIRELADLSKIALNDLRGKDREQMTTAFAALQNDAAEYARKTPKNAQERMQNELEWQTKYGAFKNNFGSGKVRAIAYQKRVNDIKAGKQGAKAQDAELKILNDEFERTDIATPISGTANFKTESFDVPTPTPSTFQSLAVGGNENLKMEVSYYNPTTLAGVADAAILGLGKAYPKEGTPEFSNLSENEKNQAIIQATVESNAKGWVDAVQPLNEVLKNYVKDVNGVSTFDAVAFENDNASNTVLMKPYEALKRYNDYNRNKFEQAKSGIFNDKGLPIKTPLNLNPNDFKAGFVDFAKGVNANQLVQSGMFAKFAGDKFIKSLTETDNAIQRDQLRISLGNLGLERQKFNKANTEDLLAVDGILREATDIINKGDLPENQVKVVDARTGKEKMVFKISDPTILQKFANIDKDGTTTNVADEGRYNPKTNEIDLVYFYKVTDDEIERNKTGSNIKEIKSLNARTWVNLIAQRTFGGQERGQVNQLLQGVITKNGGDLYKIAKALNGQAQVPQTPSPATAPKKVNSKGLPIF